MNVLETFQQLPPELAAAAARIGWQTPTAVQAQALPAALSGRDVVVCAPTGTGKTGVYALAVWGRLMGGAARPGRPRALILLPTRELAVQVGSVLEALGAPPHAVLFGGVRFAEQEAALSARCEIVVATPGRLLDLHQRNALSFTDVAHVVVDEADRLLDASFIDEVRRLFEILPERRQTMLLGATLPREMERLARVVLRDPLRVDVGIVTTPESIREVLHPVSGERKTELLVHLLSADAANQAIVFCRMRKTVDRVVESLSAAGLEASALHGGLTQKERLAAVEAFRRGTIRRLVATDLAGRGIDIPSLALVINFDVPNTPEDYIHRSGRTGRMARAGVAITLATTRDTALVAGIEHTLRKSLPAQPVPGFEPSAEDAAESSAPGRPGLWNKLEQARSFEERPWHEGKKAESPFRRDGSLRREHQPPPEAEGKPKRNSKKRLERRMRNQKLPHERKRNTGA